MYLKEHGVLSASTELVEHFNEIQKVARILMMLGLKLNVVHTEERQNEILVSMKCHINNLRQAEESAWDKYIAENKETLG